LNPGIVSASWPVFPCVLILENILNHIYLRLMKKFIRSFSYAASGIKAAFKSERNFRIHVAVMIFVLLAGFYLNLSLNAWGIVILSIGFVLVSELLNTAVERLGDEAANGKQKQRIKNAKDISAGAVLISALAAAAIGFMFLLIPLLDKIVDFFR
jgi:undecaprenol kinase